jgi:hypothetical protein
MEDKIASGVFWKSALKGLVKGLVVGALVGITAAAILHFGVLPFIGNATLTGAFHVFITMGTGSFMPFPLIALNGVLTGVMQAYTDGSEAMVHHEKAQQTKVREQPSLAHEMTMYVAQSQGKRPVFLTNILHEEAARAPSAVER